eukprot:3260703-Ditylum_brightwellii.AAC.1
MSFGTNILHNLQGKPGYSFPRAYIHRGRLQPKDPPITIEGEMEIKNNNFSGDNNMEEADRRGFGA